MTIGDLEKLGANTKEGLERCLDDEEFYLELIPEALSKDKYDALQSGIDNWDLSQAFEAAHVLKGVLGNLALTPIYEPVSEITEKLRSRVEMDYKPLMDEIWQQRGKFVALQQ